MLYAFAFDRIGVLAADLFFVNPDPEEGQEGPEQGVRLEVRQFRRAELRGSVYSATPIEIERPLWRADLLESVSNPGTLDRAHHHPRFAGWEPGSRQFLPAMTADPLGWVAARLGDLHGLLAGNGSRGVDISAGDAQAVGDAVPQIMAAVERLLAGVRAGELAQPPGPDLESARLSWL